MDEKHAVLFVDDEPNIVEGFQQSLHKESYNILTAISGKEGLQILRTSPVDVVVSDEQMPGMSGSEFLATVCKEYPETIRIILTGQASLEAAIRAINEGEIYRFLTKPCNAIDLAQTIRQALQLKKLTRESSKLLAAARKQQEMLFDLEKEHPGIAKVNRTEGGEIVLDELNYDVDNLIEEISMELRLFETCRHNPKRKTPE